MLSPTTAGSLLYAQVSVLLLRADFSENIKYFSEVQRLHLFSLSLSLSFSLSFSLSLSLFLSLPISLSFSLSPYFSLSLSFFLSLYLSLSLSFCCFSPAIPQFMLFLTSSTTQTSSLPLIQPSPETQHQQAPESHLTESLLS